MVPQEAHDNPCSKRLERGEKDATVHFSLCLQLQERERVLDTPVSRLSKQVRWTAKIPSTNYSRRGTPHTYGNLILVMLYALMLLFAYTQVHVRGDLPSHCLFRHVLGKWEMEEGLWQPCKGEGESNTLLHDPYCGYQVPDRPFDRGPVIPPDVDPSFRRLRTTTFTLSSDSTVVFDDGSTGIWTMVYDEGFHLEVSGPQNRRYFAFFKYEIAKDGTNRAWSFCHTTLIGWWERLPEGEHSLNYLERLPPFYDVPHPVPETQADKAINRISRGCWWARKLGEDLTVPTNEVPRVRRSPIEVPLWPTSKPPDISAVVAHVRRVHSADDSWSPVDTVYIDVRGLKLQKLQDVFRHTGQPLLMPREYPDPPLQLVSGTPPVRVSSARPYGSPAGTDPPWMTIREFDWTNPEHVNMRSMRQWSAPPFPLIGRRMSVVSEAPDQGGCGSCYALTTGTVLTSRLWIRYAQHDDVFGKIRVSPFQGTSCNVYNQGCDGGFVFLALKFGQEHGFRTEECLADYGKQKQQQQGSLTAHLQKCHDLGGQLGTSVYGCRAPPARATLPSSCETAIRVTSWRYVGGVYGGCSEREMLRALWEHGPLGASIEPPASFVVYKKGVFKSAYNRYVEQGPSWVWEKVDHAVVIVGWGWEKHGNEWLPYWKVRNSWGRKWGEGGYARVIRGVNEMAIERVAVMADVALFRNGLPISPRQARTGVPSRNSQTYETKHSMPSNQDSRAAPDEATPDDQESESESESSGKSYSNSDSSADESTGESNEEERSIRDGETPVTPLLRSIRAHHEQLPVQVKM